MSRLVRAGTGGWAFAAVLAAFCALAPSAGAGPFSRSAHGNSSTLPQGCGSCHAGHGSPQTTMFRDSQEAACLKCHKDAGAKSAAQAKGLVVGPVSSVNIADEFSKPSHHPLAGFGVSASQPAVSRTTAAAPASSSTVTCSSCHDPHYMVKSVRAAKADVARPRQLSDARNQQQPAYKICYRCHGSGATHDIQRLMKPGNPSYHPLEAPGRSATAPSLVQPYTAQSYVACTDCHGSDRPEVLGPHGSAYAAILKDHYTKDDGHAESAFEYALCYRCHNRSVVLSPASFSKHTLHVVDAKLSCHTCHNSHGAVLYDHLISFDPTVVFGNSKGRLSYQTLGPQRGECNLLCHGHDHVQKRY